MHYVSVFIFDSSYPSADIALPIDETDLHVVVSDRRIEPPRGHESLQLDQLSGLTSLQRNLGLLRSKWQETSGRKCIVIASPAVRKNQLILNTIYALFLCRNVLLFDGVSLKSLAQSWRLLLRSAVRALGKSVLGRLKSRIRRRKLELSLRVRADASTPEGRLFGLYNEADSFSIPFDRVVQEPEGTSIYGEFTRGWYLPMLSNHRQRYSVQTTRRRLRDVVLHVEEIGGSPERLLFKDGLVLDYPYLLLKSRQNPDYIVSTRGEVKTIERGIDLLHYTPSYYHWLVDGVPRILDLIDDGTNFDQYPLLLQPLETFQRELLRVLGIDTNRQVVTVGKGDWCHVGECIIPTANFPFAASDVDDPSGQPDGHLLRRIRKRLLERIPTPKAGSTDSPKRIYISRAVATRRKLTIDTEDSVRLILEREGFRTVCLEDFPWVEQVRLISGADFVVGVHGAGLTNVLFADAKSLLEFQNPLEARSYFAVMARELNMNYAYLVGTLDGQSSNFDNITINLRALTDLLHRLDAAS